MNTDNNKKRKISSRVLGRGKQLGISGTAQWRKEQTKRFWATPEGREYHSRKWKESSKRLTFERKWKVYFEPVELAFELSKKDRVLSFVDIWRFLIHHGSTINQIKEIGAVIVPRSMLDFVKAPKQFDTGLSFVVQSDRGVYGLLFSLDHNANIIWRPFFFGAVRDDLERLLQSLNLTY